MSGQYRCYQVFRIKKKIGSICDVFDGYRIHMMYKNLSMNLIALNAKIATIISDNYKVSYPFPLLRMV